MGAAQPRLDGAHDLGYFRSAVLDPRDEAGEGEAVAREHSLDEGVRRGGCGGWHPKILADSPSRPGAPCRLLLGEGQVRLDGDLVGELQEYELGDGDAVIAEGRAELGPYLDVLAGKPEALLSLHLLGGELDIGHARVGHRLHGLLLDGEDALDLGRNFLARL